MSGSMEKRRNARTSATPLSCRGPHAMPLRSFFCRLARLSLGAVLVSMLSGCLVEDPPPYTEPQQTPAWLDLRQAVPLIDQVLVRSRGDRVPFNVPVRSEDAGDDLFAFLLLNYMGESTNPRVLDIAQLKPSTFDDPDREDIVFDWTVDATVPEGCQRLTLLATHKANLNLAAGLPEVFDKSDVAMAVWWADIGRDVQNSARLQECPLAAERAN